MSMHVEWAEARYVAKWADLVPPGTELPDGRNAGDHCLVLENGSALVAIEGPPDDLLALAEAIEDLAIRAGARPRARSFHLASEPRT